ncbi:MAG: hypothetical protein IKP00_06630 [Victivallales bacterium]|nr:hypothetical protein [Victivallales bacterium]
MGINKKNRGLTTMRYVLIVSQFIACVLFAEELLNKETIAISYQSGCKAEFVEKDGRLQLVIQGTTPAVNKDPNRNMYLEVGLSLRKPISLVDKSLLLQADFQSPSPYVAFYVRGFNKDEKVTPWSYLLRKASSLYDLKDNTLIMTTGMHGAAKSEKDILSGNEPDKISTFRLYLGTMATNNTIILTIKSFRTENAMQTKESQEIGFSRLKENWENVKKVTDLPTETVLFKNGIPQFDIIYPDTEAGRKAANKLAAAFAPFAKEDKQPKLIPGTLKERVPSRTAIMLGNIFDNPAMLTIYARCAIIADKRWPGAGGHVVRTVFEPFKKGADVIALEASDEAGLDKAVAAFLKHLKSSVKETGGTVAIQRLYEMKLPKNIIVEKFNKSHVEDGLAKAQQILDNGNHTSLGGYLATIGKRYLTWQNPLDARLYVETCRLYRKSAVADPRKYGGPWGFDSDFPSVYAIAGWDLIEHDPTLTEQDRLDVTQTILAWLNMQIVPEAAGGTTGNGVTSNHLTFCSMGTMMGGLYFSKYYPKMATPKDWLAIIKHNFMRQIPAAKVFDDCDSYQWLTWNHCTIYSLVMPDDTFFTNTYNAKGSSVRQGIYVCGQTMDNLWTQAPYGDDGAWSSSGSDLPFLRKAYAATREPLAGLLLHLKYQRIGQPVNPLAPTETEQPVSNIGEFNGEYWDKQAESNGVFNAAAGKEIVGLLINPLDQMYYDTMQCPMPVPPIEKCYDKMAYRSALEPNGFYALVDGVNNGGHRHEDANSVLRLTYMNREWLMENSYPKPQQKFHNSLLLLANGEAFSLPDYMELLTSGENDDLCWAFSRANGFGPSDWTRFFFWLKKENAMVVVDELLVKKAASFQVRQRWNGLGEYAPRNDGMQLTQQGPSLRIQCWDNTQLTIKENRSLGEGWESYKFAKPLAHVLDQNIDDTFKKGTTLTMGALLHGSAEGDVVPWGFKRTTKGFSVDTGKTLYAIDFNAGGLLKCDTKKSSAKLAEPPKPAASVAKAIPGKLLKALHTQQFYGPFSMLSKEQGNLWLTAPEYQDTIKFTLSGDAPDIDNIFAPARPNDLPDAKNAQRKSVNSLGLPNHPNGLQNLTDGRGKGTQDSTMYAVGKEPEITITFDEPQQVNKVENLMWWATQNRKGVKFRPGLITAYVSEDGKHFKKAGSYDATGEKHKDFGEPISMPIELTHKPIKALRLKYVPQEDSAIYINEIRVIGLPTSAAIKERMKSHITCVMPFTEKDKQFTALSTKTGELFICDSKANIVASINVGSKINDIAAADIDGDDVMELLLACEDTTLKAYKTDGKLLWSHQFPFYRLRAVCTLVRVADLEQNGKLTILAGCDNWTVYALDTKGNEIWNFEVVHPTRALEVADINGDGKMEILCGTRYYYATVLDYQGRKMWGAYFARGNKGVAGVLSGEKDSTFVVGEDKGLICFYRPLVTGRPLGNLIASFATGDEVMRTVPVKRSDTVKKEDLLAVSLNGFAYRFDCNGKLLWSKSLASPVLICRALPDCSGVFGTENGTLVVIDEGGTIIANHNFGAIITDIRAIPADKGYTIAVSTADGQFTILKP